MVRQNVVASEPVKLAIRSTKLVRKVKLPKQS